MKYAALRLQFLVLAFVLMLELPLSLIIASQWTQ